MLNGYQRGLASIVYKFFDKKTKGSGVNTPLEFNEQLVKKLHKPITRKFKKRKVYSGLKDNIWEASLIKYLNFRYVLLIFLVNVHGLFF